MQTRIVELDLGVIPSPSGSGELLLADEESCQMVFVTAAARSQVAVATFHRCAQVIFGYPNDEAQPGHPLYESAWSYGFYEVHGSGWAARLEAQNRVVQQNLRRNPG